MMRTSVRFLRNFRDSFYVFPKVRENFNGSDENGFSAERG